MSPRSTLSLFAVLSFAGCAPDDGIDREEAELNTWSYDLAGLHLGERRHGSLETGDRKVYPVWVSGSTTRPVRLRVGASGAHGDPLRLAVLGPLVDGTRETLASAGYGAAESILAVDVAVTTTGQINVVVGAHPDTTFAGYEVSLACAPDATTEQCSPWRVDALSLPKLGGLSGELDAAGGQRVRAQLNGGLQAIDAYDVELWRSPPGFHFLAERVAETTSTGNQVDFFLPPLTLDVGDDLFFRIAAGNRLPHPDHGVWTRFAPGSAPLARLDTIDYGDLGGLTIRGVASYFEGRDLFVLRKVADGSEVDREVAVAALPGQPGNGLGSFEIGIAEPLDESGQLRPNLPRDGEHLELLRIDLDEGERSLGCFEYCNDQEGSGSCTHQVVPCGDAR